MSKKQKLTETQLERLRDLVAMGPLNRKPVDAELEKLGLVQVWNTYRDGTDSMSDTDAGLELITGRPAPKQEGGIQNTSCFGGGYDYEAACLDDGDCGYL